MHQHKPDHGSPTDDDGERAPADARAALPASADGSEDAASPAALAQQLAGLREQVARLQAQGDAERKRYRTLLDAVPDAVTVFDADGRIVDANHAACVRFGRNLENIKQLTLSDLSPASGSDHIKRAIREHPPGEPFRDTVVNVAAGGIATPTETHSNVFLDEGTFRVMAVARDMTAQHRAMAALAASQARYRMLLDAMDKGVVVQNREGYITSANPTACRLLAMTEAELQAADSGNMGDWRFVHENEQPLHLRDLPGFRALTSAHAIDSTVIGVYIPHRHQYRWLSITAVPQFDDAHTSVVQVVNTFSDVSRLKRNTEMFHTTQDLGDIGCWEIDDFANTLYWTEHMYRLHDLATDSVINEQRMLGFLAPDDRLRARRALARARDDGERFELELELKTAIDRHLWISLRGEPLRREGRIHGVVGTLQNISERKTLEQRLRSQATHNPLTRLPNRDSILALAQQHVDSAAPSEHLTAFYIDLDRFKVLSDMLGHKAGDRLLKAAAQRIAAVTRDIGKLGHLGNDEFLLLVAGAQYASNPEAVTTLIIDAFSKVFMLDTEELLLSVSIGVARWPRDAASAEELVQHADEAMFGAKHRGRSTWHTYNARARRREHDRLEIEAGLRRAVDNDQLRLVYQPQLELENNRLIGTEALLRWCHPQLGAVPPARFIPYAETSGDIVRIGNWVIDEACAQLAAWRAEGIESGIMAINVSHRQVLSGTLVKAVRHTLERHGLHGSALALEFTERVLIDSLPETLTTFRQLRELGLRLLIDDFGEGFSSLNYLRNLPVDGIKISHTFMQGIPDQVTDAVLCEAMIRIANALNLTVVAEGVETIAQRDFLLRLGVRFAQGYLYSRPLDVEDMVAYAGARGAA